MPHFDARDIKLEIDRKELKKLYKTRPYKHALAILFNWLIIAGCIFASVRLAHPLVYVLAVIIIGARMHALAILMHDATHYRFLKNKQWNDRITNLLSMYPLFFSIEQYRKNHLSHHQHLNTEEDPDWFSKLGKKEFTFPKTKKEFLLTLFSYLTLFQGIKDAIWFVRRFKPKATASKKKKKTADSDNRLLMFGFYGLLVLSLSLLGAWKYYALYWLVPYFSTFFMFQYIRSVAEHFGDMAYDHLLTSTRSVRANALERFLFAPHCVNYHLEHHLYPGVPFYHLPRLHKLLMKDGQYHEKAHITQGYIGGLMNELT
ncbi:MAG: hypothetical protein D6730_13460 [Bacteroidetes bacterium]|nr:MAG: hypothetical protein D6730_13460 [Bacteroidota bacterium]